MYLDSDLQCLYPTLAYFQSPRYASIVIASIHSLNLTGHCLMEIKTQQDTEIFPATNLGKLELYWKERSDLFSLKPVENIKINYYIQTRCDEVPCKTFSEQTTSKAYKSSLRYRNRQRSESMYYYNPKIRNEVLLLLAKKSSKTFSNKNYLGASKMYRKKCQHIRKTR